MVRTMTGVMALGLALSLAGPVLAKAAATTPARCPACHMVLSTKKTAGTPKMVKIGGKTYYCCAKCNMGAAPAGKKKTK